MIDLNKSEKCVLTSLAVPVIFLGFYPDPITTTTEVSVQNLIEYYDLSLKLNLIQN